MADQTNKGHDDELIKGSLLFMKNGTGSADRVHQC
jgi:hypothetical protein